jgi:hypothetical protein
VRKLARSAVTLDSEKMAAVSCSGDSILRKRIGGSIVAREYLTGVDEPVATDGRLAFVTLGSEGEYAHLAMRIGASSYVN